MEVSNFMPYTYYTRMTRGAGRESRDADFILIAEGDTTTLGPKGPVKLKNPKNPKNLFHHPLNLLNPLNPIRSAAPMAIPPP